MMRTTASALRWVAIAAVLLFCAACAPFAPSSETPGESVSDQQSVTEAVEAADPSASRVVATVSQSGASQGWAIEIDHEGDVTSEILAAILADVATLEPEPGHVRLYFFAPGTDEPLDIAPAADELGLAWTKVGSGGSWLSGELGALTR